MTNSDRVFAFWQDSLTFLLGVLLFISPWVFGFESGSVATSNAHLAGAVLAVMGVLALFAFQSWEDWVSGLVGA